MLVDNPVLSLISKRAKAVLPETFLCQKPFMLETSELNWVQLRPIRNTLSHTC